MQAERRGRPAHIDLPRHDLGQRRRRTAGRGRLGLEVVLLHERGHDAVRRRAVGRIGDRLALGILERLDRRACGNVPVKIGCAGGFGTDDAHGSALGIRGEHAHDSGRDADVRAAGDDGLQRLASALRP